MKNMKDKQQAGFSYIDVMIAVVILLVGILALVSAITGAIFQTKGQEQQLNAKQIATSTMESIMSVKETDAARLGWNKVGNICATTPCPVPQGIFLNGVHPVKTDAGPDEVVGTNDDTGTVMTGFTRQIIIRDECDQDRPSYNCNPAGTLPVRVRSIEINVNYYVGSIQRQERLTTVLTNY
jgi:type II secretory pathway pseudopilin PulG